MVGGGKGGNGKVCERGGGGYVWTVVSGAGGEGGGESVEVWRTKVGESFPLIFVPARIQTRMGLRNA